MFELYVKCFPASVVRVEDQTDSIYYLHSRIARCSRMFPSDFEVYVECVLCVCIERLRGNCSLFLYAVRGVVQESSGFSSFMLVFRHSACVPLKLEKERWLGGDETSLNLLDCLKFPKQITQSI